MPAPAPEAAALAQPLLDNIARHLAAQWQAPAAAIVRHTAAGPSILAQTGLDEAAIALLLREPPALPGGKPPATRIRRIASGRWRFLASAPLRAADESSTGALVVLDHRPRTASQRNRRALGDLATVVSLSLALHQGLETLQHLAITDPLTGLYNRRGLDLLFAEHDGAPMALLAIDIDDFKAVNDAHGHGAGDALLVRVAEALRRSVRVSDIVARTGGDEFAILLPDTPDAATATQVAARIAAALEAATVSIGIARAANPHTLAALKAAADGNLRAAKAAGKARTVAG